MRPQDWPALLDGYVEAARRTPFAWGLNDCVSWTCGWYALMTGRDAYAAFRGAYDTHGGATRVMHANGVHGMDDAGRFLFGPENKDGTTHIGRGDIAYAQGALGICTGGRGAFLTHEGLTFLRHDHFDMGWSVD